jgi:hypothetical protein
MAQVERPEGVNRVVDVIMSQAVDPQLRLHMIALAVGPMGGSTSDTEGAGEPNYSVGALGANDVDDE